MLNLVVEKRASKDCEQSRSSITRPRTGTPIGFVQISRLDFGLRTSPYIVDIYFLLFSFSFSFIVVDLTSSQRASLTLTLVMHSSIATAIYFITFPSYYLYFHLY